MIIRVLECESASVLPQRYNPSQNLGSKQESEWPGPTGWHLFAMFATYYFELLYRKVFAENSMS